MTLTLAQARSILDKTLAAARGTGSRRLHQIGVERPHMAAALVEMTGGTLVPVPGGVLIRDKAGELLGAVGVSGDTSDNDEVAAIAGIEAAGFVAETGG
jgi:uncharacterized protein GlcG (DUF336 family)